MVGFAQEQDINVDRYGSIVSLSEFLSKIGTHLLASSDIMEKIGTLLPQKYRFLFRGKLL
jgi:hypothetical protein